MINSFRQHDLGLPPIRSGNHGGMILDVHKAPFMCVAAGRRSVAPQGRRARCPAPDAAAPACLLLTPAGTAGHLPWSPAPPTGPPGPMSSATSFWRRARCPPTSRPQSWRRSWRRGRPRCTSALGEAQELSAPVCRCPLSPLLFLCPPPPPRAETLSSLPPSLPLSSAPSRWTTPKRSPQRSWTPPPQPASASSCRKDGAAWARAWRRGRRPPECSSWTSPAPMTGCLAAARRSSTTAAQAPQRRA